MLVMALSARAILPSPLVLAQGPSAPTSAHPTTTPSPAGAAAPTPEVVPPLVPSHSASSSSSSAALPTPSGAPNSTNPPTRTPGPATNPYPAGTVNCFDESTCGANEECFVLNDGLVCLDKTLNWGYILAKNASGIPSVPGWSGPRSTLNTTCQLFQMPESADKPGLALMVYDLIRNTLPEGLVTSRFDQVNWYTLFSNCEPNLACRVGTCLPRPTIGHSCTSSWQCNPQALGLDENNIPIPSANVTQIRCEYEDGDKSTNTTCQLLYRSRDSNGDDGSGGISAWYIVIPIVALMVVLYFAAVIYQRRMRRRKLMKWSRRVD
ncbi:hypothetical protein BGW38_003254, partial [Lunasporangiospora selenospora]